MPVSPSGKKEGFERLILLRLKDRRNVEEGLAFRDILRLVSPPVGKAMLLTHLYQMEEKSLVRSCRLKEVSGEVKRRYWITPRGEEVIRQGEAQQSP